MHKLKKTVAVCCLWAPLLWGAAACRGQNPEQALQEVKVSWRGLGSADPMALYFQDQRIQKKFEEESGLKLKLQPVLASEGDYFAKIALALQSQKTSPDLIAEDTFTLNSDVSAGYLRPLDDDILAWPEWQAVDNAIKQGVIAADGRVYGMPTSTDARGLWYNKEVFRKAGLETPWQPRSWEDILQAARQIKAAGAAETPFYLQVGRANGEAVSMQTFNMLLYGTRHPLYENGKWLIDSPGLNDAFAFIETVFKEGLGPKLAMALTGNAGTAVFQELLPAGSVGIALDGIWNTANWLPSGPRPLEAPEEILGFAAMPNQYGGGFVTMTGGWAFSIPARAANPQGALKLLKFVSSYENSMMRNLMDGQMSPRADALNNAAYAALPFMREAAGFLANARFRPANTEYPLVSAQIQALVEQTASGALTAGQAAQSYGRNVLRIAGPEHVARP